MCGNSGHREAVITFFCFEKVSISLNIPAARQALRFKTPEFVLKKDF